MAIEPDVVANLNDWVRAIQASAKPRAWKSPRVDRRGIMTHHAVKPHAVVVPEGLGV